MCREAQNGIPCREDVHWNETETLGMSGVPQSSSTIYHPEIPGGEIRAGEDIYVYPR